MLLKITGDRGTLVTQMTPAILPVVRSLEGHRKWIVGKGLSFAASNHNIRLLQAAIFDLVIERQGDDGVASEFDTVPNKIVYNPILPPMPHQAEAKKMIGDKPAFALFMEQGTGKTMVALWKAAELYGNRAITGVLVIAPRGVHRQWAEEQIPTHLSAPCTAVYWDAARKLKELPEKLRPGSDLKVFAINYDSAKMKEGKAICKEFVQAHLGRVMMILDESQNIKDVDSLRWKAANEIGQKLKYKMMLTGTPIAKNLLDEWAQLKWLDPNILGVKFKTSFKAEFCILGGWTGDEIVSYKNMELFRSLVDPYAFRVTKEDLGMIPPLRDHWHFDLTAQQKTMIKQMRKFLLAQIDASQITAANAAVSVMRMQQISNGFGKDDNDVIQHLFDDPKKNPRVAALLDLIDSVDDRKIIIWARFIEDIKILKMVLGNDAVVYGGSDNEREKAKSQFMTNPAIRFFLSNPATGGTGLNLQGACRRAVYYSNSDNSIHRWQSEARIHRIGMTGVVNLTDLVGKGGIDNKILLRHDTKKMISEMAIGEIKELLSDDSWDE